MLHPFQDKLFIIIGKSARHSRQAIRDELTVVGGVTDDNLTTFIDFVLALGGSEKTKVYQRALQAERYGQLSILSEEQFFDILEGRAAPPEKPEPRLQSGAVILPTKNMEAIAEDFELLKQDVIESKRINSLAKHGIPTSQGRMKIDFRRLNTAYRIARFLEQEYSDIRNEGRCDICGSPATVYISGQDGKGSKLCVACHNRQMAELTGAKLPDNIPKQISLRDAGGTPHLFEIEFMMFPNGMTLTAREVGQTRYKADIFGEINYDFDKLWKLLIYKLEKLLSVKYMGRDGYFNYSKAIGYIEYNHLRDAQDIIIDGRPYSWQELEKNISAHEGFQIKIEFGDYDAFLD